MENNKILDKIYYLECLMQLPERYSMGTHAKVDGITTKDDFNKYIKSHKDLIALRSPMSLSTIIRTKDESELIYLKNYSINVLKAFDVNYINDRKQKVLTIDELWEQLIEDFKYLISFKDINNFNIIDISILILSLESINSLNTIDNYK